MATPKSRIRIDTEKYEASHGCKPRGRGRWYFGVNTFPASSFVYTDTFTLAQQEARAYAAAHGGTTVTVLP